MAESNGGGRLMLALGPSNIGDALMCLPALREAARQADCPRIILFLGPRAYESLKGKVAGVDTRLLNRPKKLKDWLAFGGELRRLKPNAFVDFRRSLASVLVRPFSAVSWGTALRNLRPHAHQRHAAEQAFLNARLSIPQTFGAAPEQFGVSLSGSLPQAEWRTFFEENQRVVALQLGASHGPKRYPTASYQELAALLEAKGWAVVWLGVLPEEELPQGLPDTQLNLINRTSFEELILVLGKVRAVISNDGGPMHLAAAMGVPVLGLFGQTDGKVYGPYSPGGQFLQSTSPCSPCNTAQCRFGDPFCLKEISPGRVMLAFEKLVENTTFELFS